MFKVILVFMNALAPVVPYMNPVLLAIGYAVGLDLEVPDEPDWRERLEGVDSHLYKFMKMLVLRLLPIALIVKVAHVLVTTDVIDNVVISICEQLLLQPEPPLPTRELADGATALVVRDFE